MAQIKARTNGIDIVRGYTVIKDDTNGRTTESHGTGIFHCKISNAVPADHNMCVTEIDRLRRYEAKIAAENAAKKAKKNDKR